MAPIKLEDNFREKLEDRELQPTPDAWSRLETTLPAAEGRGKNTFFWYAIAASFVGILIIASVFFNETKDQKSNELVVEDVKEDTNETTNNDFINQETVLIKEQDKGKIEIASEEITPKKETHMTPIKKEFKNPIKSSLQQEANASVAIAKVVETSVKQFNEAPLIKNSSMGENNTIIKAQIDKVVAQVQAIEQTNTAITAEEINNLLTAAQREIQTQRILGQTKVDAAALLQDVENDLERSFRDKVFDALGDGYSVIRTAVVERNN